MQKQLLYFANHFTLYCTPSNSIDMKRNTHRREQEAQLSQRGRAMLRVSEYFVESLKVIQDQRLCSSAYGALQICFYDWKMVPFERLSTVCYWHSIATTPASLAVSTQCTNVTVTQTDRQTDRQTLCDGIGRAYTQHRAANRDYSISIHGGLSLRPVKNRIFFKFI